MSQRTIGVVGGGIVGLAVARELAQRLPSVRVTVLEKEDQLGTHQTGRNSGVVHAGIYYRPGSLKAELCARGRALLRDYAVDRELPYDECGKLVVAVDPSEVGRLDALQRTARDNAVPGLRRLGPAGIVEIERHAVGVAALHSPATAITDYAAVAGAFAEDLRSSGGRIMLSAPVVGIARRAGGIDVRTDRTTHRMDRLVVCAGLQADRVSRLAGGAGDPRIVPFRGEYMTVVPAKRDLVRAMVYPVPDPRYPFLGVHFTRRVSGALEVGPNAVLALDREGYRRSDMKWEDVRDLATWPGFWRLARQHWRTGAHELRGSVSVQAYMERASRYVPAITAADVVRGGAGVRAQAVARDGSLVDDFLVEQQDGVTTVRNAPSPAATSSMAVAELVADRVLTGR
jgi:L-2-hydroxyglutarate oxidase LhgO